MQGGHLHGPEEGHSGNNLLRLKCQKLNFLCSVRTRKIKHERSLSVNRVYIFAVAAM